MEFKTWGDDIRSAFKSDKSAWDKIGDVMKTDGKIDPLKVFAGTMSVALASVAMPLSLPVGAAGLYGSKYFDEWKKKRTEAMAVRKAKDVNVAELDMRINRIQEALTAEVEKSQDVQRYFDLVVAMYAVGLACAACDGNISAEEHADIKICIAGNMFDALPKPVRQKLDYLSEHPPTVATAAEIVKLYSPVSMDLFNDIIELIVQSDGVVDPSEIQFCDQWKVLTTPPTFISA